MSLRCLCLPDEPRSHLLKRVKKIQPNTCDLVEVGIEAIQNPQMLKDIRKATGMSLVLACRGKKLTQETVSIYHAAIDAGWEWVDVDMNSPKKYLQSLMEKIDKEQAQMILSAHINHTPSLTLIRKKIEHIHAYGKSIHAIPKVVTTMMGEKDLLTLLQVLSLLKYKVILHASGEKSRESRLLMALAGSHVAYLCLTPKLATAKGQWTIQDWNRTIRAL